MGLSINPDGSFSDTPSFEVKKTAIPKASPNRSETPQTRSPASNVNQAQFKKTEYTGKRRASNTGTRAKPVDPSADSGYRGSHAKGAHARDYDMQADLDKSRAKNPHVGTHSARAPKPEGKHGKPYNAPEDIQRTLNKDRSGKGPYVSKHTPQGQATRAKAAKSAQRQQNAAAAYKRASNMQHALHMYQRHFSGKHYTHYLRAMETKV